jgi:hypothetical protein
MRILSLVRLAALVAILAGGLSVKPVSAFGGECPDQGCGYCPATWSGPCYIPGSTSCSEFDCDDDGTCGDNNYTQCNCAPCA